MHTQSENYELVNCHDARQMTCQPTSEDVFNEFDFADALEIPYRTLCHCLSLWKKFLVDNTLHI